MSLLMLGVVGQRVRDEQLGPPPSVSLTSVAVAATCFISWIDKKYTEAGNLHQMQQNFY